MGFGGTDDGVDDEGGTVCAGWEDDGADWGAWE